MLTSQLSSCVNGASLAGEIIGAHVKLSPLELSHPTGDRSGDWCSSCHRSCSCRAGFNSILLFCSEQACKALEKVFLGRDAGAGSGKVDGKHLCAKEYGQALMVFPIGKRNNHPSLPRTKGLLECGTFSFKTRNIPDKPR